jgi:hypothetical protein
MLYITLFLVLTFWHILKFLKNSSIILDKLFESEKIHQRNQNVYSVSKKKTKSKITACPLQIFVVTITIS